MMLMEWCRKASWESLVYRNARCVVLNHYVLNYTFRYPELLVKTLVHLHISFAIV